MKIFPRLWRFKVCDQDKFTNNIEYLSTIHVEYGLSLQSTIKKGQVCWVYAVKEVLQLSELKKADFLTKILIYKVLHSLQETIMWWFMEVVVMDDNNGAASLHLKGLRIATHVTHWPGQHNHRTLDLIDWILFVSWVNIRDPAPASTRDSGSLCTVLPSRIAAPRLWRATGASWHRDATQGEAECEELIRALPSERFSSAWISNAKCGGTEKF